MPKSRLEAFSDGVIAVIITLVLRGDRKGKLSVLIYAIVAAMWFVPDGRIERHG